MKHLLVMSCDFRHNLAPLISIPNMDMFSNERINALITTIGQDKRLSCNAWVTNVYTIIFITRKQIVVSKLVNKECSWISPIPLSFAILFKELFSVNGALNDFSSIFYDKFQCIISIFFDCFHELVSKKN